MSDVVARAAEGDLGFLDEQALADFVVRQRWFGAKSREVVHAGVLEALTVRREAPLLAIALVEVRFQPGTHDVYQVPLGLRPASDGWDENVVAEADGWTVYDALSDPELARELARLIRAGASVEGEDAAVEFRPLEAGPGLDGLGAVRPMGAEQSNTSVVFDERLVLKAYRRLEAGVNPELELLRFLTEHEFPNVAALAGWYEHSGRLMDATLATLQAFVPGETDGWAMALDSLTGRDDAFFERLRRLGEVTGEMHATLASDSSDPAFAPEEPSGETLGILAATIDEEIGALFSNLPADPAVEPIAGRSEEVRDRLRALAGIGSAGRRIRHHGDYHLGQALWTGDDWVILDFEGEPARSLPERRRKRSPLRDVAGMLRSLAYAASVAEMEHGVAETAEWEERAREEFLAGYLPAVEAAAILPPGRDSLEKLLALFELEKAVYELRYELDHRPDWVQVPVAGIARLLEPQPTGAA
jgi:trehalose synthase-fused probable maltokinase